MSLDVTPDVTPDANPDVERAYAVCREIAREQAKNFYYAFIALPKEKRNAICAVYAFMRRADDLSDDESLPRPERRAALDAWLSDWRRALAGEPAKEPIFVALKDAQKRFAIPPELLDQLVEGTAMDLASSDLTSPNLASSSPASSHPESSGGEAARNALDTYATFDDLYRYCYLVASVVGLVCIRIFGYSDPRAEKLAEETGIAFQLTNILRDVREDAARGRLYLPLADLDACGVKPEDFTRNVGGRPLKDNERRVLAIQAQRATEYYRSAQALLPLIAADSRPALWVLVTIYRRLLTRIERRNFDVFSAKISVPAYEKGAILGRGIAKTFWKTFWLRASGGAASPPRA